MKLDDIELIKRVDNDGAVEEIRSIYNLSISGKRRIVELEIPGLTGNVFQDLGRNPLLISFEGELVGSNTMSTLQDIKSKFELREPVPFSSDIAPITDITEQQYDALMYGSSEKISFNMVAKNGESRWTGRSIWEGLIPQSERLFKQTESEYRRRELEKLIDEMLNLQPGGGSIGDITSPFTIILSRSRVRFGSGKGVDKSKALVYG